MSTDKPKMRWMLPRRLSRGVKSSLVVLEITGQYFCVWEAFRFMDPPLKLVSLDHFSLLTHRYLKQHTLTNVTSPDNLVILLHETDPCISNMILIWQKHQTCYSKCSLSQATFMFLQEYFHIIWARATSSLQNVQKQGYSPLTWVARVLLLCSTHWCCTSASP